MVAFVSGIWAKALSEAGGSPPRRYRGSLASGGPWAVAVFSAGVASASAWGTRFSHRKDPNQKGDAPRGTPARSSPTTYITAGSGLVTGREKYSCLPSSLAS